MPIGPASEIGSLINKLIYSHLNVLFVNIMAKITFVLDDDLMEKFREVAFKKYGIRKGSLSEFGEFCIRETLKREAKK